MNNLLLKFSISLKFTIQVFRVDLHFFPLLFSFFWPLPQRIPEKSPLWSQQSLVVINFATPIKILLDFRENASMGCKRAQFWINAFPCILVWPNSSQPLSLADVFTDPQEQLEALRRWTLECLIGSLVPFSMILASFYLVLCREGAFCSPWLDLKKQ